MGLRKPARTAAAVPPTSRFARPTLRFRDEERLRGRQRPQQPFGLVPGFFVFALRVGLGHDAAADGELPPAAAGRDRADQDVEVQRPSKPR